MKRRSLRAARSTFPIAALVAVMFGHSSVAHAQDAATLERAKASFRAGANAYAAGDYPAAIQALESAYELTPLPAIAFSLAQAERKQYAAMHEREHLDRALALFQRYLDQEPNGPRRADALAALLELKAQIPAKALAEAAAKPASRPTRLMIVCDTQGAKVALDAAPAVASPLIREVTPGKHHVHVEAKGYVTLDRDVTAVQGELISNEVHLQEAPVPLTIWAPEGAEIYVDGDYLSKGGWRVTTRLAVGRHEIMVAKKGRKLARREVQLERGKPQVEVVDLEATRQRQIARVLFISGGAALGAGIVLSAFAVQSQNDAEDYLAIQAHKDPGSAALVSYNASIVERNRYRTAAAVSVAGSVGFFITALFLRELDQPSLSGLPRREAPEGRDDARDAQRRSFRLAVVPSAPSSEVGASLRLNF